ncbi:MULTISPECIES: hypothetical protein [Paenarthrobacter]|uniref:Uncharacterized protein n=1 Tax=Paenarthrobacter ureafaciens TaxID=37931 RepID=A0AAX3ED02_PAEUR|nr:MULTISPECIES: hypothetical protein [Paenarthrobacter]NKR13354.1 hypothetical protein [Arthrobacter sp. M5]NKR14796.1 hypothetical protein [Arthrobacter sp. M6]OEH62351.1 hypothetical protein A5N13_01440 [Arthrobacter sp. D4]OEH62922.1 hypothetical protein A5N17_09680 [Arthrobacter sp. D2]MDO5865092.1 hypothetical protein [Paenarthrobacter sp. SD-2]
MTIRFDPRQTNQAVFDLPEGGRMRLDVMTAADKYGCNHETLRRLFKQGGIEGRYETYPGRNGSVQKRLTFDEADLEAAFAGPLAHIRDRANHTVDIGDAGRLDVREAAQRQNCSEARIRQSFKRGDLRGEYAMTPGRGGRLVRKLTFDEAALDECFGREMTAQARHEAHVAKIRATAVPLTDEQKSAIASVFIDHLREKRAAERAAAYGATDAVDESEEFDEDDEDQVQRVGLIAAL